MHLCYALSTALLCTVATAQGGEPRETEALLQELDAAIRAPDYSRLPNLANEAARRLPDSAEQHALLGEVLLDLVRHDEACAALRSAIDIDPSLFHAHALLARAEFERGRLAEAGKALEMASELDVGNPDVPELRALLEVTSEVRDATTQRWPDDSAESYVEAFLDRLARDPADALAEHLSDAMVLRMAKGIGARGRTVSDHFRSEFTAGFARTLSEGFEIEAFRIYEAESEDVAHPHVIVLALGRRTPPAASDRFIAATLQSDEGTRLALPEYWHVLESLPPEERLALRNRVVGMQTPSLLEYELVLDRDRDGFRIDDVLTGDPRYSVVDNLTGMMSMMRSGDIDAEAAGVELPSGRLDTEDRGAAYRLGQSIGRLLIPGLLIGGVVWLAMRRGRRRHRDELH